MFRRVVQLAPMAALLTIGMPEPSANAVEVPSLQSDEMLVLAREGGRRGGDNGNSRGGRGDGDSRGSRSDRGDNGGRGDRGESRARDRGNGGDGRESRRRPSRNNPDFGFREFRDDAGCERLRRRAIETGSSSLWRRYRACVRG